MDGKNLKKIRFVRIHKKFCCYCLII